MGNCFRFSAIVLFCFLKTGLIAKSQAEVLLADLDQAKHYRLGRGLQIPGLNLMLGGYANMTYHFIEKNQRHRLGLDDLSLFVTWTPHDRLRFFSELEIEDGISTDGLGKSDQTFRLERLYLDILANESLSLRLGKFLTPVGLWNSIHAAPLVWTTTRPLATENSLFAPHVSGLSLNQHLIVRDHDIDISVYFDDSKILDPRKTPFFFKNAFGGRIQYEWMPQFQIGFSYIGFKNHTNTARNHLYGLDLSWSQSSFELKMEYAYRHASDRQGQEHVLYVQGVAPLGHQFYGIARYEYLNGVHPVDVDVTSAGITHVGVTGLAWRPYAPLIIKSEYRFGKNNAITAPSGFFASISVLF